MTPLGLWLRLIRVDSCSHLPITGKEVFSEFRTTKPPNRLPTCVNMSCFADERPHVLLLVVKILWRSEAVAYSQDVVKALKRLVNWRCQTYSPSLSTTFLTNLLPEILPFCCFQPLFPPSRPSLQYFALVTQLSTPETAS